MKDAVEAWKEEEEVEERGKRRRSHIPGALLCSSSTCWI